MSSRRHQAKSLFMHAAEIASDTEREAFLADRCGGDTSLRGEVLELLAHRDQLNSFLEAGGSPPAATLEGQRHEARLQQKIGAYKVRELLAEGGMGVVYVAEQTEPVRRKVALKIIKPGMATKDVVARFEAERQALAMMDHPNIARVFDGGETDAGEPYFVMELVLGIPITEFCDQRKLNARERLELLLKVCRAVQHAHQKGIIHRDLKPSNVLVTEVDDAAVPKVIDFGVAKAVSHKLTDQTVYTQITQMIGTPLYMSPEQTAVGIVDLDTRSDVYSLGVLMYELLTSHTPFDRDLLSKVGFDELRRMIREDDPSRPSNLLSTLKADAISTVAQRYRSDPRKLVRTLRGELDWITMKALEKDRNRRFESASALAEDLERYLSDQPVSAGPPSAAYRLRKYARRHKAQLLTVAAVAVVMIAASVISTALAAWALRERELAQEQQQEAVTQTERAEANLQLSLQALDEIYFQWLETRLTEQPELDEEDERFLEQALPLYEQLAAQKGDDPQAELATARAYLRVGGIQHELERYEPAAEAIRQAAIIAGELVAAFPAEPSYAELLIESQLKLADTVRQRGRLPEAEQILGGTLEHTGQLSDEYPAATVFRLQTARGRCAMAGLLKAGSRPEEAVEQYESAIEIYRQLVDAGSVELDCRPELSATLGLFGDLLIQLGRQQEAEAAEQLYSQIQDDGGAGGERSLGDSRQLLALRLENTRQYREAERVGRQALEMQDRLIAERPHVPDYRHAKARTLTNLGTAVTSLGRLEEAEELFLAAIDSLQVLCDWWPRQRTFREDLAFAYHQHANALTRADRLEQAEQVYRSEVALRKELLAETVATDLEAFVAEKQLTRVQLVLGDLLKATGRDQEAVEQWGEALSNQSEAAVDYRIRITNPGNYQLFLRGGGHDHPSKSVYARIVELADGPGGAVGDWYQFHQMSENQDFQDVAWNGEARFESAGNPRFEPLHADPEPALWQITEPGEYTLRFSNFDFGMVMDTILFTKGESGGSQRNRSGRDAGGERRLRRNRWPSCGRSGKLCRAVPRQAVHERNHGGRWMIVPTEGDARPAWSHFRGEGYLQSQGVAGSGVDEQRHLERGWLPADLRRSWDIERYTDRIAADSENHEWYLLRAETHDAIAQTEQRDADFQRVLELLTAAHERNPEDLAVARRRAEHLVNMEEFERAAQEYAKLVEKLPDDAELWFGLAYSYSGQDLHDRAIEAYTECLQRDPNPKRFVAYNNRGGSHASKGELDKALANFAEAIKIEPKRALPRTNRARIYAQRGDLDRALAEAEIAVQIQPYWKSYAARAELSLRAGDLHQALADFDEVLRRNANVSANFLNNVAWQFATTSALEIRDPRRAVDLAEKSVEAAPDSTVVWNTLGVAQYRAERFAAAINNLNKSLEMNPEGTSLPYDAFFLAMAHWQLGDQREARQWYEKAIEWMTENESTDEELLRFQAEAEALLGMPSEGPKTEEANSPEAELTGS